MKVVFPFPAEAYESVEKILAQVVADQEHIASLSIMGFNHEGEVFMLSTRLARRDALWLSEKLRAFALAD